MLGSTIRLTIYLSVLGSLQFFDLIWVMTTGGPVGASDTMATYLYKFGFQRFQLGLWQRDRRDYVRDLLQLFTGLSAFRAAP